MAQFANREYTLDLVTPAFLGGYDQSAEWRTAGINRLQPSQTVMVND